MKADPFLIKNILICVGLIIMFKIFLKSISLIDKENHDESL